MAMAFEDGSITTLASELDEPMRLGLTTTHAFITVDGAELVDSAIEAEATAP
jgi:hypothetical protein